MPVAFGSYLVHEQIGKGGMATIHVAEVVGTGQRVALKRLLPRAATSKALVDQFEHEARLMKYLRHPNIAETFDFGQVGNTHYLAMEYVPGPTLRQLVNQCGETVGAMPVSIALNLAAQLCDALDHAHTCCDEHGKPLDIIHRDVSPANIILADTGLVKLIDFGLAKAKVTRLETGEGVIKGKFGYVAPEYLGGRLDARADLWAVGVVMYELLTGRRLFEAADDFETMTRVRRMPIPRPSIASPRVPAELDDVVMQTLERDPDRRWSTAAALRDALHRVIANTDQHVEKAHVVEWVNWVYTQMPGSDASGLAELEAIVRPAPPDDEPTLVQAPPIVVERHGRMWVALAIAVAVVLVVAVIVAAVT